MIQRTIISTILSMAVTVGALLASCGIAYAADDLKPFSFVQLCDPQLGMGGYEHDVATFTQSVKFINALAPEFVVICGDLVNEANEQSFADFIGIKNTFTVPAYCAPGNHDMSDGPSLERYRKTIGDDYYMVEHKGYTLVVVNTQLWKMPIAGESEKHDAWVKQTLEEARAKRSPIVVVGHYPLFITQPDEAEEYFNLPLEKRTELLDLFVQCGVVAYLSGHAHKTVVNEYEGIQLVSGPTTSKAFDKQPLGFTRWVVEDGALEHSFMDLTMDDAAETKPEATP